MRWRTPLEPTPKPGDTRIQRAFLWLPMTIGRETRWLERAAWKEWYFVSLTRPWTNGWKVDKWYDEDDDTNRKERSGRADDEVV